MTRHASFPPRTQVALLFLVLLVGLPSVVDALLPQKIRVPLYQRQYVQVKVGSPGRILTLRLRWDLHINYLYDSPYTYSNTFSSSGSDVFYLSPDIPPLRLPVVYGQEPSQLSDPNLPYYNGMRQDTNGGVTYNGVLGMGSHSYIWRYWHAFTLSKFTLVLGGYDALDTLANGVKTSSKSGFATFISALGVQNGTLSFDFKPEEDFTYMPMRVYPRIYEILFKNPDHRIANAIYPIMGNNPNFQTPGTTRLLFWMSSKSSVIVTSFGAPEMSLRIAEREGKNTTGITLGRIHMLEDFVYYQNKVSGEEIIQEVYDTFPATQEGHSAEAFMSLIALLIWAWWALETAPMVYQWNVYGVFPRVRQICNQMRNSNIGLIVMTWNKRKKERVTPGQQQQQQQPPSSSSSPQGGDSDATAYPITGIGPIDWTTISCLLFLARMTCFWTFFTSLYGHQASRFVEHLARLSYLEPVWGIACYYALIAFMIGVPLMVNTSFIRRYTHAGVSLVSMAMLICVWINRLPDTTNLFFSVAVNLLLSTLTTFRAFEWIAWSALRGSDSAISATMADVKEFPTEASLASTRPTSFEHLNHTVGQVKELVSDAIERMHQHEPSLLVSKAGYQHILPVRRTDGLEGFDNTLAERPYVSDQELMRRNRDRPYSAGEIVLLVLWTTVLLPCTCVWLVTVNLLPLIEVLFPVNPARFEIAIFYLGGFAIFFAWATACGVFLQIMQQGVIDIREALIELAGNISAHQKNA